KWGRTLFFAIALSSQMRKMGSVPIYLKLQRLAHLAPDDQGEGEERDDAGAEQRPVERTAVGECAAAGGAEVDLDQDVGRDAGERRQHVVLEPHARDAEEIALQ